MVFRVSCGNNRAEGLSDASGTVGGGTETMKNFLSICSKCKRLRKVFLTYRHHCYCLDKDELEQQEEWQKYTMNNPAKFVSHNTAVYLGSHEAKNVKRSREVVPFDCDFRLEMLMIGGQK